nr:hypothetical protein [uncultured Brumimicrobium sp.]
MHRGDAVFDGQDLVINNYAYTNYSTHSQRSDLLEGWSKKNSCSSKARLFTVTINEGG